MAASAESAFGKVSAESVRPSTGRWLDEWAVETSLDGSGAPTMTRVAWRLMHAYDRSRLLEKAFVESIHHIAETAVLRTFSRPQH